MEKERQEIMNDKEHSIFDKSLDLNLKLVSKEMGRAVFWGVMTWMHSIIWGRVMGNVFSLVIMIAGGIIAGVFFVMGLIKLYYKSVFSEEAYLHMCLPIPTTYVIVSKILVPTYWMLIFLGSLIVGVVFSGSYGMISETVIAEMSKMGLPYEHMGIGIVLILWNGVVWYLLINAIIFMSVIVVNTFANTRYKLIKSIMTIALILGSFGGVTMLFSKILGIFINPYASIVIFQILSFIFQVVLIILSVMVSKKFLENRYNLK